MKSLFLPLLAAFGLLLVFVFKREQAISPPSSPTLSDPIRSAVQSPVELILVTRPQTSPDTKQLLSTLLKSYLPYGPKGTRFKTQRALDQLWVDAPPLDLIILEALDTNAPMEYRIHFANRLSKIGKKFSREERELLSLKLNQVLTSGQHSIASKAVLTGPLLALHDSSENLRAVADLISDSPDDLTSAALISALTLSKSPISHEVVADFITARAGDPDSHAVALRIALPPLIRESGPSLVPSLEKIIIHTGDAEFLRFTTGQLLSQPPSAEFLSLISLALDQAGQFTPEEADKIRGLVSGGLIRWSQQSDPLSKVSLNSLNQIQVKLSR